MEQQGSLPAGIEWLPPAAALARFEPGEGMALAHAGQLQQGASTRYGFRVGDLGLLIDPDAGSEVLAKPQVAPLPASPPGFLGLINLRGTLVPLYDMPHLLGGAPSGNARLALVLGAGEQAVGMTIETHPAALFALRPLSELPPLPEALAGHVPAGYVQDGKVWLEFDHASFFDHARGAAR